MRARKWIIFFAVLFLVVASQAVGKPVWQGITSVPASTMAVEEPAPEPKEGIVEKAQPHPEPPSEPGALVDIEAVLATLTSGSRFVGTAGNTAAGEYLEGMLREIGVEPLSPDGYRQSYRQSVEGQDYTPFNVAGRIRGREGGQAVVLSAHFDTESNTPGAVDNASGCAAVLRIAEQLASQGAPATDVVLCFFNGEEQYYIGSAAFLPVLEGMYGEFYNLNIDSVGMKDGGSYMMGYRPDDPGAGLIAALRDALGQHGLPCDETVNAEVNSDHKSFLRGGYPGVTCSQENLYDVCHTERDTAELIDYAGLERLCEAVTDFILSSGGEMIQME